MKKKIIVSALLLFGLLLCSAISCFADSTSEAVLEAMAEQRGTEKYLENVRAPSDNTEDNDHIDTTSGNVVISETDLYLPGKNGMDVTLTRHFNSMETDRSYEYLGERRETEQDMFAFLYSDDNGNTEWITFTTEEEMLAAQEFRYNDGTATQYYIEGTFGTKPTYEYRRITKNQTGRRLTLERPIQKLVGTLSKKDGSVFKSLWQAHDDGFYKKVGYNWYLNIPSGDPITIRDYNVSSGGAEKIYLRMYDGTTEVGITYYVEYTLPKQEVEEAFIYKTSNSTQDYNVRPMTTDEEALLRSKIGADYTLRCCIIIERGDGMRYFVNSANESGKILMVADRYDNCIDYSKSGEIIDTYGRRIVYSSNGIQMEDENGVLQYIVKYTTPTPVNPDNSVLDCLKTYPFKVERFHALGDTQTDDVTVYNMKKVGRSGPDSSFSIFYYTIDKITYPTGAHRDYTYDYVEIHEPYFGTSSGYIEKSRGISSILYDSNTSNYEYSYEYVYNKPNEGYYTNDDVKARNTFTVEKTKKAPSQSGDVTTTYVYDYLSRLRKVNDGSNLPYPKYQYTYNRDVASGQPSQIITKLEPSVTKTDSFSYVSPHYAEFLSSKTSAGLVTNFTYDFTDSGYDLPTIITYTPEGGNAAVKTVTNTLTADKKSIAATTTSDADGIKAKTEFEYNSDGTVSKTKVYTDTENNVYNETAYSYTYNTDGSYSVTTSVNNVKDADGANAHAVSVTTVYDRFGNVASQTDANGVKTEYTYDLSGRVLSVKVLNNSGTQLSEKTYSYDVSGNVVDITRENGRQEKQLFDSFGNLKASQVNYEGGFKTVYEYTYDTFGRPATATENARLSADGTVEEKYVTTNVYDDRNRVVKQTTKNKAGTVVYEVSTEYGGASGKQYTTQWLSGSALYSAGKYKSEYDAFGRKTADVILNNTAEYSRTDYTYDCFGNVLTAKDDKARAENLPYSVSYAYDHAGRVLSETDVFGNAATNTYDNAGQLLTATDRSGMVMSYTYDALGRAVLVHDGSTYVRSYYDDNGNLVKEIEASSANGTRGHIKTYEYDDLNRLTYSFNSTSDTDLASYNGVEEYYSYDVMGNVLTTSQHSDGGHFGTTYTYDILGRKTTMKDAEDNTETYTYNLDGTLKTKTDREGTVFTYSNYNVFKNAQSIKAVNGDKTETLAFTYDMMNNLTREAGSGEHGEIVRYEYDFLGRLTNNAYGYLENSYTYDSMGNRTSFHINSIDILGAATSIFNQNYTYDAKGRLTESTAFDKSSEYGYNESDQIVSKTLDNIQTVRTRNSKNLVTQEVISNTASQGSIYTSSNTYDFKSDLTREETFGTHLIYNYGYEYDGANRLQYFDADDMGRFFYNDIAYQYDNRGNITTYYKLTESNEGDDYTERTETFQYSTTNQMFGIGWIYETGQPNKVQGFQPNNNGSREIDGDKHAGYDLFNRMIWFSDEDDVTTTYTYSASGMRLSKTVPDGTQTYYIWDGGNLVLEYRVLDMWEMECAYDNFYVYGADGLAYRKDAQGDIFTYSTNYRGDVVLVTDENQTVKAEYAYEPYGRIVDSYIAPGFSDNFGYRGEYHDPESGYIYLRNRYLDPKTGSFTTEDPIRDGLNWFSYCNGNPVKFTDPWGLAITCDEANSERIISLLREVSGNSLEFEYKDGQINITKTYDTKNHVGQTLVSDLINASETVNVNIGVDRDGNTNTEWPASGNDPMQIFIDPDNATGNGLFTTYTQDADGNVLEEVIPAYIVFGHELIHSWRDIRGLDVPSRDMVGLIPQDSPQLWREEELQTMGINYTDATGNPMRNYGSYVGIISENGLRLENGLNVRISYYGW